MKKIIVFTEVNFIEKKLENVSYELVSKASELVIQAKGLNNEDYCVEAVALCDEIDNESVNKVHQAGANEFVLIKNESLKDFCQTVMTQSFVEYLKTTEAEIIIFPATPNGRIIAPRIATILETGLVADCTGLDFMMKDSKMVFAATRPTFGSELMATILTKTKPQCATVRPQTFIAEFDKQNEIKYSIYHPASYNESRLKLVSSVLDKTNNTADFVNTKIMLTAGYGLVSGKDREYFEKLEKLASLIGASVGSTRKVVDIGLMDQSTQIGITGATVSPDVYIGFGVSGAIQHIMGMKNSKIVIAINTDENAEIFKYADYKIVADAKKIIDELLSKFEG